MSIEKVENNSWKLKLSLDWLKLVPIAFSHSLILSLILLSLYFLSDALSYSFSLFLLLLFSTLSFFFLLFLLSLYFLLFLSFHYFQLFLLYLFQCLLSITFYPKCLLLVFLNLFLAHETTLAQSSFLSRLIITTHVQVWLGRSVESFLCCTPPSLLAHFFIPQLGETTFSSLAQGKLDVSVKDAEL